MLIKNSLLLLGLAIGVLPQTSIQPPQLEVEGVSSTSHRCWTSGSGATYFQVCVSKHGSVVQLKSPAGIENIRLGDIGEGYVACAGSAPGATDTSYYDAGSTESGWAEPYKLTAARVISRKTEDGKLELVQSFFHDSGERDFTITMTLYNRSAGPLYSGPVVDELIERVDALPQTAFQRFPSPQR